jgi:hypothetical protein
MTRPPYPLQLNESECSKGARPEWHLSATAVDTVCLLHPRGGLTFDVMPTSLLHHASPSSKGDSVEQSSTVISPSRGLISQNPQTGYKPTFCVSKSGYTCNLIFVY